VIDEEEKMKRIEDGSMRHHYTMVSVITAATVERFLFACGRLRSKLRCSRKVLLTIVVSVASLKHD
jgi:hypothetical protein